MKQVSKNRLIYRELYHKHDSKVPSDKKIKDFKWEFVTPKKRKPSESKRS